MIRADFVHLLYGLTHVRLVLPSKKSIDARVPKHKQQVSEIDT